MNSIATSADNANDVRYTSSKSVNDCSKWLNNMNNAPAADPKNAVPAPDKAAVDKAAAEPPVMTSIIVSALKPVKRKPVKRKPAKPSNPTSKSTDEENDKKRDDMSDQVDRITMILSDCNEFKESFVDDMPPCIRKMIEFAEKSKRNLNNALKNHCKNMFQSHKLYINNEPVEPKLSENKKKRPRGKVHQDLDPEQRFAMGIRRVMIVLAGYPAETRKRNVGIGCVIYDAVQTGMFKDELSIEQNSMTIALKCHDSHLSYFDKDDYDHPKVFMSQLDTEFANQMPTMEDVVKLQRLLCDTMTYKMKNKKSITMTENEKAKCKNKFYENMTYQVETRVPAVNPDNFDPESTQAKKAKKQKQKWAWQNNEHQMQLNADASTDEDDEPTAKKFRAATPATPEVPASKAATPEVPASKAAASEDEDDAPPAGDNAEDMQLAMALVATQASKAAVSEVSASEAQAMEEDEEEDEDENDFAMMSNVDQNRKQMVLDGGSDDEDLDEEDGMGGPKYVAPQSSTSKLKDLRPTGDEESNPRGDFLSEELSALFANANNGGQVTAPASRSGSPVPGDMSAAFHAVIASTKLKKQQAAAREMRRLQN